MLEILEETAGNLLAVRLSGKQLHADTHELANLLDARIAKHGAARALIELHDIEGIEPGALREGLQFDLHHTRTIRRCAIVGDREWERWVTGLMALFFHHADVRFFHAEARAEAVAWVRE